MFIGQLNKSVCIILGDFTHAGKKMGKHFIYFFIATNHDPSPFAQGPLIIFNSRAYSLSHCPMIADCSTR